MKRQADGKARGAEYGDEACGFDSELTKNCDNRDRKVAEINSVTVGSSLNKSVVLGERQVLTPTANSINNPLFISATLVNNQLGQIEAQLESVNGLFPSLASY